MNNNSFNIKNFTYSWFIFSIIIVIIIALFQVYFEYKKAIKNAITITNNLTTILIEKLENDFDQANNILKFAEDIVKNLPNEKELNIEEKQKILNSKFNFLINNFKNISAINYLDANGNIIYSSNISYYNINLSDRRHFLELKNNKNSMLSFSDVITNKNSLSQILEL